MYIFSGLEIFVDLVKIINNKMVPWQVLADGNGNSNKGFKGEWMTVKGQGSFFNFPVLSKNLAQIKDPMIDQKLYVGGIGMEYVLPNGAIASEGGKFVKIIDHKGSSIWFKSDC